MRNAVEDSSIDVPSFMAALRIKEMDDDEARNVYLDGLREAFEALGVGAQLSMFDGAKDKDA